MYSTLSPSQSPSSLYSHAPTVIHHSAHRSALARRATRQLSKWTESPSPPSVLNHHNSPSPRRTRPASTSTTKQSQAAYSYNGNYNKEYQQKRYTQSQYSPYSPDDGRGGNEDDEHLTSMQDQSGPTVRKYAELNFDEEDEEENAIGFAQVGRREKIGGEWGTPESALAGIGRQATKIMKAATKKTGNAGVGLGLGMSIGTHGMYGRDGESTSPVTSVTSRGSGARKIGELLSAGRKQSGRDKERDLFTSGSKVSIASDQSRDTSTTRTSSSESSVGEAVITPNHSSAFTPYLHDHSHGFNPAIKYTYPTRTTATIHNPSSTAVVTPSARIANQHRASQRDSTPKLAPSAQISDPSAKLSPANFSLGSASPSNFAASDRPLMSSGSPGFGLISLEVAQERERVRLGGPTPKSSSSSSRQNDQSLTTPRLPTVPPIPVTQERIPQDRKVKNKKSLISLFRSATSYASGSNSGTGGSAPPVPGFSMVNTSSGGKKLQIGEPLPLFRQPGTVEPEVPIQEASAAANVAEAWSAGQREQESSSSSRSQPLPQPSRNLLPGPKLELRPVSMMLANGLPEDYLATSSTSDMATEDSYPDGLTATASSISSATSSVISADDSELADGSGGSLEILALRKELANLKKTHQYQQSELASQLREAKDQLQAVQEEMVDLRVEKEKWGPREDGCTECGCTCGMAVSEMLMGSAPSPRPTTMMSTGTGVMGRARSGTTSRSVRSVKSTKSTTSSRGDYSGIQVPSEPLPDRAQGARGVMDRGRVKTGGARGVFGTGSLYEWE